jgi:integrase
LWQQYTEFKRSQLAHSTIERDYNKIGSLLAKMPDYLETAIEIRDWLLKRYAAESTRRYLMQFNACCRWAYDSDLLSANPFDGLTRHFRRKVNQSEWTGFTADERDRIIQTFSTDHPFYAPWVKFLFWTGCRPEEAAALRWKHITSDRRQIQFREAAPVDTQKVQKTKTGKSREFPVNARLRVLLLSLPTGDRESLLFTGEKGGSFEYHNFQTRYWKPTIEALVESGQVALYRPQYHCRHTFITLALDHLSVKDIAYLVGNSPDIIFKHYASRSRKLELPEF